MAGSRPAARPRKGVERCPSHVCTEEVTKNISTFLRQAVDIINASDIPAAGVETALTAIEKAALERLELPVGTRQALWNLLLRMPLESPASYKISFCLRDLRNEQTTREALELLLQPCVGKMLAEHLVIILGGHRAAQIPDSHLWAILERSVLDQDTTAALLLSVSAQRSTPCKEHIRMVLLRWAAGEEDARLAAVELLPAAGADAPLLKRFLIDDASPKVRIQTATEVLDVLDLNVALELLREALAVERVPRVRRVLLRTQLAAEERLERQAEPRVNESPSP